MSLFDSGKSALKDGSTRILVNALVGIKARPGWLIVVSGHTDNTGSVQLNQTLSLQRAEAVRNWMRDTGDVPEVALPCRGMVTAGRLHQTIRLMAVRITGVSRSVWYRRLTPVVCQAQNMRHRMYVTFQLKKWRSKHGNPRLSVAERRWRR
ncbi:OmpA/MotB domain-containing protein [Klebsiella michiganensis]|nr:OmpA/MotB domain-containing protein [Klebsiella michiganensis]